MEKFYTLMRKDDILCSIAIGKDGKIIRADDLNKDNYGFLPVQVPNAQNLTEGIRRWWTNRHVPIDQGGIKEMLSQNGFSSPEEYLINNLGLSLTDYYWIRPIDEIKLRWKDVNLFENKFKAHEFIVGNNEGREDDEIPHYTPNGSLQGSIEKTWAIAGKERYLIKGNRSELSAESINEVIATKIHELQGYDNYAPYELITIPGKDYTYGCMTKAFTSNKIELIPAWEIFESKKRDNSESAFEHFISTCKSSGMDTEMLRNDLDYMLMTDFIISEYDRHYNNFGIVRDADTLEWKRMAPIYDSGGCFFVNRIYPTREKDLYKIKITSFNTNEKDQMKHVTDPGVVDLTKLPPVSYIQKMYEKDENMTDYILKSVTMAYEKKIDMARDMQLGKDPWREQYSVHIPSTVKDAVQKERKSSTIEEIR